MGHLLCIQTGIVRLASSAYFRATCPLDRTEFVLAVEPANLIYMAPVELLFSNYESLISLLVFPEGEYEIPFDAPEVYQSYFEQIFNAIVSISGNSVQNVYERFWDRVLAAFPFRDLDVDNIFFAWPVDEIYQRDTGIQVLAFPEGTSLPVTMYQESLEVVYTQDGNLYLDMWDLDNGYEDEDEDVPVDAATYLRYTIDMTDILTDLQNGSSWVDIDAIEKYTGTDIRSDLNDLINIEKMSGANSWQIAYSYTKSLLAYYSISNFDEYPTSLSFRDIAKYYPYIADENGWWFLPEEIPDNDKPRR